MLRIKAGETMTYDPLFVQFIVYFNVKRDYFECHEVMEELWLEEGRDLLYQGLLQVAVALYHHRNGNISGATKLFRGAVEKLERYPERILGIELGLLLNDARAYLAKLERYEEAPFAHYDLNIVIADPLLEQNVRATALEME
ncbi:hypothetical protein PAE9249_00033 [Paenibacillus sp. CECT 9249]|nr:hypothetical protein PAE9249_00033 [Paenibacillus sp. CECT 9249]